ncbi:MAG: cell division protein ZapA [Burkholderiales bacterium]|jgi:cell division protein ZapA|nr:cell division protein ZapA [Burkholderiales bacterium]
MSAKTGVAVKPMQIDVSILGRDYKVACKEDERAELMQAVALLDARMREIRDAGKVAAVDRIAVMAALNLANELLRSRAPSPSEPAAAPIDDTRARRRIQTMQSAIDQVMAGQDKLL